MYGPSPSQHGLPYHSTLPPRPDYGTTPSRPVDNRPSWMTTSDTSATGKRIDRDDDRQGSEKTVKFRDEPSDKRGRLCVVSAAIFISKLAQERALRQMPLDLDNGLPGVLLRLGLAEGENVCFMCHVDSCAAMNTGNLLLHQYVITQHPHLVAEYVQYDDSHPFEPIQLQCAVDDATRSSTEHGRLTAIVRYHTPYTDKHGNAVQLSFGLGADVAVRSIIGKPTLKAWQCNVDFGEDKLVSPLLLRRWDLIYEAARQGLPQGITFNKSEFRRPSATGTIATMQVVSDILPAITDGCDSPIRDNVVIDDNSNGYLTRQVERTDSP